VVAECFKTREYVIIKEDKKANFVICGMDLSFLLLKIK
jgi:hypothetical protein